MGSVLLGLIKSFIDSLNQFLLKAILSMPCSMKSGLDCYSSFRERVYVWERDKDRVRQINKDRKGES